MASSSYEAQVREAQSPQEAMALIAQALDTIIVNMQAPATTTNPWGRWGEDEAWTQPIREQLERPTPGVQITGDTEHTDVVIPAPSPEKMQRRREFEQQHLHLAEHLGGDNDWNEAYAKGGPLYLYLGNRDLVMSYPGWTKQQMIMDVEEDSPKDAHEMGRDLLKADCETGPGGMGMRMAEGEIG